MRDELFKKDIDYKFSFNADVADVFDDMINRSIPYYSLSNELIIDFILENTDESDVVYDIGSSSGSLLINLHNKSSKKLELIGIDNSKSMIEKSHLKAKNLDINFICEDIQNIKLKPAKIIIANYILQFIRPLERLEFLKKIYSSLGEGGILFLSEKIICLDSALDKQLVKRYYKYKEENGYTKLEISKKRESLENILIPYSENENKKMLNDCGFKSIHTIFAWVNFMSIIAKK